jgi:hypothetical protein
LSSGSAVKRGKGRKEYEETAAEKRAVGKREAGNRASIGKNE